MPLIGTAGHVDHGKSTLIERLTGRDPDRWAEEKERGLTIDLGFSWVNLPDGSEVSFVDVPGHERYMKNMLAGIEAIDVAVLVVAADESWMPQTEEHLAVLDLLEVRRGVVALTKIDSVDDDFVELAILDVEERIAGTSLAGSNIVPVSALTGEGIDDLTTEIQRLIGTLDSTTTGRPRLWVDRSFPIAGAGTVVTGTLLDGDLAIDDTVEIYPKELSARVRGIQSHESDVNSVAPGRRVALNLSGVDYTEVTRGDMVGRPGQWRTTTRFSAQLTTTRYADEITARGAYTVHVGSGAYPVTVTGRSDNAAVLKTQTPITLTAGDRFILRDTGRKLVVGGGRVVDVSPKSTRAAIGLADQVDEFAPDTIATQLLESRQTEHVSILSQDTAGGTPRGGIIMGDLAVDAGRFAELEHEAIEIVETAHDDHPLRPGVPIATLSERLAVDLGVVEAIVEGSTLQRLGPDVAMVGHTPQPTDSQQEAWTVARTALGAGLDVPNDTDLGLDSEMLAHLIRTGQLVRISGAFVYLPEQIETLAAARHELAEEFTVAEFRDATELSRKYAVPILEWMDKEGLTIRRGETRRFR